MAATLDVTFRLDESLIISATITDSNGDAANLTGLTTTAIQWSIGRKKEGPRLATLAIGTGITVLSAAAGTIQIKLAPASQDDLTDGFPFYHECRVVTAEGTSIQFAGTARILKSLFATA